MQTHRGMSSAARKLDLVAKPFKLVNDQCAVITLNLDLAVLDRAARTAPLLELFRELTQFVAIQQQARNQADALAAAALGGTAYTCHPVAFGQSCLLLTTALADREPAAGTDPPALARIYRYSIIIPIHKKSLSDEGEAEKLKKGLPGDLVCRRRDNSHALRSVSE